MLSRSTVRITSGSLSEISAARSTLLAVDPPTNASMPFLPRSRPESRSANGDDEVGSRRVGRRGRRHEREDRRVAGVVDERRRDENEPLVAVRASCSSTRRGSVARSSPPAFVSASVRRPGAPPPPSAVRPPASAAPRAAPVRLRLVGLLLEICCLRLSWRLPLRVAPSASSFASAGQLVGFLRERSRLAARAAAWARRASAAVVSTAAATRAPPGGAAPGLRHDSRRSLLGLLLLASEAGRAPPRACLLVRVGRARDLLLELLLPSEAASSCRVDAAPRELLRFADESLASVGAGLPRREGGLLCRQLGLRREVGLLRRRVRLPLLERSRLLLEARLLLLEARLLLLEVGLVGLQLVGLLLELLLLLLALGLLLLELVLQDEQIVLLRLDSESGVAAGRAASRSGAGRCSRGRSRRS